MLGAEKLALL